MLRKAILPAAILLALTLLYFNQLAFSGLILGRGDTFAYFYPYWAARNSALLAGKLPLWTPDLFMGVPLLANSQLGTFYPLNWPLISLSPPDGIRISILLHVYWALLGAYTLAWTALPAGKWRQLPALVAAVLFGLGGYVSAHVEQINQLQGLAWMPWLFWLYHRALVRPVRYGPLLAAGIALQFFTGHTQTVFITALGLALYGLVGAIPLPVRRDRAYWVDLLRALLRPLLILAAAGGVALLLAAPQLIPTLEMTDVSNRRGGFNQNEATAFSFNPLIAARGLLPSYDGAVFGEYIAYLGLIGLALAVIGALRQRQRAWTVLALAGLLLAFGEFNPLYWPLATLPGFNLFRVPARWLALFALGGALLAGAGLRHLVEQGISRRVLVGLLLLFGLLGAGSLLAAQTPLDVTGPAQPTAITWTGWGIALLGLLLALRWRRYALPLLTVGLVLEVLLASAVLPLNTLVPPEVYSAGRFPAYQLRAYIKQQTPPGRILSVSGLYFDTGDKAALEAHYQRMGLSEAEVRQALVDTKMQEVLAANLPLIWDIPTIDGFDGGLLPTRYYTAFAALMQPPGQLRTIDGRLRELLALPECGGACIPDQRWLNLTGTRYLITDKVYDIWYEDVAYDTQFHTMIDAGTTLHYPALDFVATAVDVLYAVNSADQPRVLPQMPEGDWLTTGDAVQVESYQRVRLPLAAPGRLQAVEVAVEVPTQIMAVTLVDTRTGDFVQLTPWPRLLSSDIKLYENPSVLPRAFVVGDLRVVEDSEIGTETALQIMAQPDFDPAQIAILSASEADDLLAGNDSNAGESHAQVVTYLPERVEIQVQTASSGYLLLADAYYPGWRAWVNDSETPIYRADVMFRAVPVPAGESTVIFEYAPAWLRWIVPVGVAVWLVLLVVLVALWWLTGRRNDAHDTV
ncbi:MAG: YfhO family protein [Anaerolineae bacterium]|nr:YfhO family protein [Anaerolineae bacterium]